MFLEVVNVCQAAVDDLAAGTLEEAVDRVACVTSRLTPPWGSGRDGTLGSAGAQGAPPRRPASPPTGARGGRG